MPKHWMTLTTREGRVGLAVKLEQHLRLTTNLTTKPEGRYEKRALCTERTACAGIAQRPQDHPAEGPPFLWQARGRRFESAMLHPKINLRGPPFCGFFDSRLGGGTQKGTQSDFEDVGDTPLHSTALFTVSHHGWQAAGVK